MNDLKYKSLKNIGLNYFEKKVSLLKNESYYLWKLNKNWEMVVGKIISDNTEPKFLKNGVLFINVDNSTIYHNILTYQVQLIDKINNFFETKLVNKLEIKKVFEIKRSKIINKIEKSIEKEIELEKKYNKLYEEKVKKIEESYENIKLTKEEIQKIENSINNIDKKYLDFSKKLHEIAINRRKKDKFLLKNGYEICEECKEIFYPGGNEKICFNCYEKKERKKEQKMTNLIIKNPYISEKIATKETDTEEYIYYKIRDILAQKIYIEILYFCENKNIEIETNLDYNNEIRAEAKKELEKLIKNFIDYKIGTNDQTIFENERKKLLKKIKNEINFRKKYKK